MRVLLVTSHRNQVGGVERYLQSAMRGLLDRGHDLALLHAHPFDPSSEAIDPPYGKPPVWCLAQGSLTQLLSSIAEWNPHVVYFHGVDHPGAAALEDALLARYPVVLYSHNYDRTCPSGRKCHRFPHPQSCTRRFGLSCLLLYYPRRCGGLHPGTALRLFQEHGALHARLHKYAAVLVASKAMYGELQHDGVDPDKLHLVRYPVTDVEPQWAPPVRRPWSGEILFLGRLTDLKGADYLIRAIPRAAELLNRPLHLTIAGDGPEGTSLRNLAAGLRQPATFFGWATTNQKTNLIRNSDLLAIPSIWPEPFGLVGIEAGCFGVPAAGFALGGIPDWLTPGENGDLAPGDPPTVEGLAHAIRNVLYSPEHYARLSFGAWKVAQRYRLDDHLEQLESILAGAAGIHREQAAAARYSFR